MASPPSSGEQRLDRSSWEPLHHQLQSVLRGLIEAEALAPGSSLPGELRLCEQYGVSRTVVRQALVDLEHAGLIERIKGRGTFVAQPLPPQGLVQSLTGQFEDMASLGLELVSKVRRLELVTAEPPVTTALDVAVGSDVVLLERLRLVEDEPWVLASTYLHADLLPALERTDLEKGSLYVLMDTLGQRPTRGTRTIEARHGSNVVTAALGVAPTSPLLLLTSIGYRTDGRPVEYFRAYHRGDRSRFEVRLPRSDQESSTALPILSPARPALDDPLQGRGGA